MCTHRLTRWLVGLVGWLATTGGYAAGYYSYKWAEVLSADAFAAFGPRHLPCPPAPAPAHAPGFALLYARARACVRPDAKHLHVCLCLCAEEAGLLEHGVDHVVPVGERFRATVLGLGGSQHPMDVFKAFRGREPSVDALLRHNGLAEVEATAEVSG